MIELNLDEIYDCLCRHERVLRAVEVLACEQGVDVEWCVQGLMVAGDLRRSVGAARDACGSIVRM